MQYNVELYWNLSINTSEMIFKVHTGSSEYYNVYMKNGIYAVSNSKNLKFWTRYLAFSLSKICNGGRRFSFSAHKMLVFSYHPIRKYFSEILHFKKQKKYTVTQTPPTTTQKKKKKFRSSSEFNTHPYVLPT